MYSKYISPNPRAVAQRGYNGSRLNWLIAANEYEARRRRHFRNAREEEQLLLMRHPISAHKAYGLAGLLLGVLPPAAIFARLFGYGLGGGSLNMAFGIPIGSLAFLIFAVLHRTLERGGMIEARHFVPLACGITAIITVLIWKF